MKIRFLKTDAVNTLYSEVPKNLENYKKGDFSFIEKDTTLWFEGKTEIDVKKLSQLKCGEKELFEKENCELIFQAMGDISPYIARDERAWVYLTHTQLLEYSRRRWSEFINMPDEEEAVKFVRTHFFGKGNRGIERDNSASRLWWMAYICSRVDGMDMSDALECFLYRSDVRANIVERPTTSQSIRVFSSIIRKLYSSLNDDQKLFDRQVFRPFMVNLNLRGGVQLLDSLNDSDLDALMDSCSSSL